MKLKEKFRSLVKENMSSLSVILTLLLDSYCTVFKMYYDDYSIALWTFDESTNSSF